MIETSFSFNVGGEDKYKPKHNKRIGKGNVSHIDNSRKDMNVYYDKGVTPDEMYERVFGDAIRKYNDKQTRNDRKITDYYKKMKDSSRVDSVREIIMAVGECDDNIDVNLKRSILLEYVEDFIERNKQFGVFDYALHMDEANPHLHVDFVPFYDTPNAKRGLERSVSMEGAIKQQGFKSFKEWRSNEVDVMNNIMMSKGLQRVAVGSHDYQEPSVYKQRKEEEKKLQNVIAKRDKLHIECFELENKVRKLKDQTLQESNTIKVQRSEAINTYNEIATRYKNLMTHFTTIMNEPKTMESAKRFQTLLNDNVKLQREIEQAERDIRERESRNRSINSNEYER